MSEISNVLTLRQLSFEAKTPVQLFFPNSVLPVYDNFLPKDTVALIHMTIQHIRKLMLKMIEGKPVYEGTERIHKNHTYSVLKINRENELQVAICIPYLEYQNYDGYTMHNYILIQDGPCYIKESHQDWDEKYLFHRHAYAIEDINQTLDVRKSTLLKKLIQVIAAFNALRERPVSERKGMYNLEELFTVGDLEQYKFKKGKAVPNYLVKRANYLLWHGAHAVASFISIFVFLDPMPVNRIVFIPLFFALYKSITLGGIYYFDRDRAKQFKRVVSKENVELLETSGDSEVENTKFTTIQTAYSQLGNIQLAVDVKSNLDKEIYKTFVKAALETVKDSEMNPSLFDKLMPLYHLYLPSIEKALGEVDRLSLAGDKEMVANILTELELTVSDLNQWLSTLQSQKHNYVLEDLNKVRSLLNREQQRGISLDKK